MLGKLLKYDLFSLLRVFAPLWLALVAVALVNRFTTNFEYRMDSELFAAVFWILYFLLIVAVVALTVVLVIQRFYNGLLKDEGYLMFTLPVRPWQLVLSKGISAVAVILLSMVVGALSVGVITLDTFAGDFFIKEMVRELPKALEAFTSDLGLTAALFLVSVVVSVMAGVMQVYASLAIGHLSNRYRIALAAAAYIGINTVFSTLTQIVLTAAEELDWQIFSADLLTSGRLFDQLLLASIGVSVLQIVLFYVVTERILSKQLNLA